MSEENLNIDWERHAPKPPDVSLNPWVLQHKRAISQTRKIAIIEFCFIFFWSLVTYIFVSFSGIFAVYMYLFVKIINIFIEKRVTIGENRVSKRTYVGFRAIVTAILFFLLWFVTSGIWVFYFLQPYSIFKINLMSIILSVIGTIFGIILALYSNKSTNVKYENLLMQ